MSVEKKRADSARRTSFVFPAEAASALAAIRSRTYLEDDADVIRIALSVYDNLLELAELHCAIFVSDESGREWPFSPYTRFNYPALSDAANDAAPQDHKSPAKSFFFSGEAVSRIDSIRERSEVRNHADAIRLALTVFNQLVLVHSLGHKIIVRTSDGSDFYFNVFNPKARQMICMSARGGDIASVA